MMAGWWDEGWDGGVAPPSRALAVLACARRPAPPRPFPTHHPSTLNPVPSGSACLR